MSIDNLHYTERPVELKLTCLNMRHKLMYVDERHATPGLVDTNSGTRVYFCVRTCASLGPDREPVHPTDCRAGRGCYEHPLPPAPSGPQPAPRSEDVS